MTITITADMIANAVRKDSHHCMVADAVHAAIPEAQYVLVDTQSIRYSIKGEGVRYIHLTPLTAQRAIVAFDQGQTVKPFKFNLPPVHTQRKMGWVGQNNRKQKSRKGTRRYRSTGRKLSIVAYRERAFGLRNIPE